MLIILGGNAIGRSLVWIGFVAKIFLQTGIVFGFFVALYFYIMHKFVNDCKRKCFNVFVIFDINANQFFIDEVAAIFFAVWVIRYLNIGLILLIANVLNTPIYNGLYQFGLADFGLKSTVDILGINGWCYSFLLKIAAQNEDGSPQ